MYSKTLQRVIFIAFILGLASAGLFDQATDTAKKAKKNVQKGAAAEAQRRGSGGSSSQYTPNPEMQIDEQDIRTIARDKSIEETENYYTDKLADDEEHAHQWANYMQDFVADEMLNIVVPDNSYSLFFEEINHAEGVIVKGAFFVHGGNEYKRIGMVVMDPNNEIVYSRKGDIQGVILFKTTVPGEYQFAFINLDQQGERLVTLALHTYEDKEEAIQYDFDADGQRIVKDNVATAETEMEAASEEEISVLRSTLRQIQTASKQVVTEAKFSSMRQNTHNEDILASSWSLFYVMVVEVIAFLGISFFQLSSTKKSLDHKLIL